MWLIGDCAQSPGNVNNPQFFRGMCTIPGDCAQSLCVLGNVGKISNFLFSPYILRRKCIFFKSIHIPHSKLGDVSTFFKSIHIPHPKSGNVSNMKLL